MSEKPSVIHLYRLGARTRQLADMSMRELRLRGENCDNPRYASRGQLIEWILIEELEDDYEPLSISDPVTK